MHNLAEDARFWDRMARKYARDPIKDLAGYERTLNRTWEFLNSSDTVLEVGCGTGTTALWLAPAIGRLVGTDVSSEMIAIAREKAAAKEIANAEFSVAAAEEIAANAGAFDAVLAFNVLHLVTDRPAVLSHLYRVLKPGGLFISKTPCLTEMNAIIRLAIPVMQAIGKAPAVSFFSASGLEADIEQAGFQITERSRHGSKPMDPRIFLVAQKAGL